MTVLKDIVREHLKRHDGNARALAEQCQMSYPTALAVVNKGTVPRKSNHRDNLRRFLGLDERSWADILLSATGVEFLANGSPTAALQLLVAREMFFLGLTEQSLAKVADVPYPTVLNLIRKGTIPRKEALKAIANALSLKTPELFSAADSGKTERRRQDPRHMDVAIDDETQGLAQLVARHIASRKISIGAFAKEVGIGYLTLSRFLTQGRPPNKIEVLEPLRQALGMDPETFAASLQYGNDKPEPASVSVRIDGVPADATALQAELIRYMRRNKLTIKSISQKTGLSQITISRLIKQGAMPKREKTHRAIRKLLNLDQQEYETLLSREFITTATYRKRQATREAATAERAAMPRLPREESTIYVPDESDRDSIYEPDAALTTVTENALDEDIISMVHRLDTRKQERLRHFLQGLQDESDESDEVDDDEP